MTKPLGVLESQVPSLFRISLSQKVTIPALSEMIIKANPIKTLPVGTNVVIDSTAEALQIKGLLIAKTLCVTNAEGLPLRMINVTDQPQTIYKNTFAAMAETIPDQNIINKFPLSTQHPEISVFNETMERCEANLTPDEHKRVLDLLMQNKDVFSQSKYDM